MVSFTAGATTTKLGHKQKTEFTKTFDVTVNAVSVVNKVVFKSTTQVKDFNVLRFKIVAESQNQLAIITDVGWRNSNQLNKNIPYIEKLKDDLVIKESPARYCRSNC